MYNEELKKKFIIDKNYSPSTALECKRLFDRISEYEYEKGADFCTFDRNEVESTLSRLIGIGISGASRYSKLNMLQKYADYCILMNIPGANSSVREVSAMDLDKVRQRMVSSPSHLQRYLDGLYPPESYCSTEDMYRCYFWMVYGGILEADIPKIKCEDVDFESMSIQYCGTEIPLYRESIKAFHNCVEATSFRYIHPLYNEDTIVYRERIPGDTIFRGIKATPNLTTMRNTISKKAKQFEEKTGMALSYKRVRLSGLYYRMYNMERAGVIPNFKAMANEYYVELLRAGRTDVQCQRERTLSSDYEMWKAAFY